MESSHTVMASLRYSEDHKTCTIGIDDDIEFEVDTSQGGIHTLTNDETGEQYVFSVDDEELGADSLYQLTPIEIEDEEEEEEEEAADA